jgi:hypothetical protein
MKEFHKEVPALYLPREYEGDLGSVEELRQKTMEEYRDMKQFFVAEEKLRRCYENK